MSLREEILEECVKAEAHKPSQIIPIAIRVFEKRIDSKIEEHNAYLRKYLSPPDSDIIIDRRNGLIEFKKEILLK